MTELRKRTFYGKVVGKKYWYIPYFVWKKLLIPGLYALAIVVNLLSFILPPHSLLNLIFGIGMGFFLFPYLRDIKEARKEIHIFTRYTLLRDSVNDQGHVFYYVRWEDGSTGWIRVLPGLRQRFSFQEIS